MGAVDRAVVHLQQATLTQFGKEFSVQSGPDSGFGPVSQAAPGGHARAAHHLTGHVSPRHALAQDVDDACHAQLIRNKIIGHPADPAAEDH